LFPKVNTKHFKECKPLNDIALSFIFIIENNISNKYFIKHYN